MKTLTVTLKQHTPLIHFQYNQDGATLRASELKPRLDKYLIDISHPEGFDFWKDFLVGGILLSEEQMKPADNIKLKYKERCEEKLKEKFNNGFRALDYKIRIRLLGLSRQLDWENYPMYFGNQKNAEFKHGVFCDKDILLEFSSEHEKLLELIDEELPSFLSKTNFGTRQTKGYGSFYIKKTDQDTDKELEPSGADYFFTINATDMPMALESLADFYSVLRAGINNKGLYIKSALFKYLKNDNLQWDKKTIKEKYYSASDKSRELVAHEIEPSSQKEALLFVVPGSKTMYKELLGLSTLETWQKGEVSRKHDREEIKRFKSPILFKPIIIEQDNRTLTMKVYIYISNIPEEMRGQNFKIKWNGGGDLVMTTSEDFSPRNYFDWIYRNKGALINDLAFPQNRTATERRDNINKMFRSINKLNDGQ